MGATLLAGDLFALEVIEVLDPFLCNDVIPCTPGELQDDDRFGSGVCSEDFTRKADHVHRAAEHRGFARQVVSHLANKIVPRDQLHVQAHLLIGRALACLEIPVGKEGGDVATPKDVGDFDGFVARLRSVGYSADLDRPDQLGKKLLGQSRLA